MIKPSTQKYVHSISIVIIFITPLTPQLPNPSYMRLANNPLPLHNRRLHCLGRPDILILTLKHCPTVSPPSLNRPSLLRKFEKGGLQNANSSNVRFAVSGNKNHTNTTSYVNHATYTISHFHEMSPRPMGFTKVVKKPARRPKSWKTAIPRERSM